jgi:hypothetical protein
MNGNKPALIAYAVKEPRDADATRLDACEWQRRHF